MRSGGTLMKTKIALGLIASLVASDVGAARPPVILFRSATKRTGGEVYLWRSMGFHGLGTGGAFQTYKGMPRH
jgi:hypothetical protein